MPLSIASGTNTFVPNHEATNGLIVGFSRNPKSFRLSEYIKMTQVKQSVALYATWNSQNEARVIDSDAHQYLWADGADAPDGHDETDSWQWLPFTTERRAVPFTLGQKAVDQASWEILLTHSRMAASKSMVIRTQLAYNAVAAAFTSSGVNTNTATALGGGKFDVGTSTTPYLKKGLAKLSTIINKQTLGIITPDQLAIVMNPNTATSIANSAEVHDYCKGSPFAMAQLRGDEPNLNGAWGLPTLLYNHPVIVENTVRLTSKVNAASATLSYVVPDDTIMVVARQGELEGLEGSPDWSTIQMFWYGDELTVESKYDADNRRYQGRVVQDFKMVVPSQLAGYLVTATSN